MSRVFEYMKWSCPLCRGIELLSARSEGWSGRASMLGGLIRPEILRCRLNLNSSFLFMFCHRLGYPGILVLGTGFIEGGRQRLTTSSWIWLSQNLPERTYLLKARGESPQYHKACAWNPEHFFEHLIYGTIHCTSRLILLPFSKKYMFPFCSMASAWNPSLDLMKIWRSQGQSSGTTVSGLPVSFGHLEFQKFHPPDDWRVEVVRPRSTCWIIMHPASW